jgi:peptidyl-prolyl cis-trans isomerase D
MMAFFRKYSKGLLAWITFIIIVVPFALWGINEYMHGSGETVVAKVGDRVITLPEYQNQYQRELARRKQILGANFDAADPAIKRDVLDRMVNTELVSQSTVSQGFRISDARLGEQIRTMKEFQAGGKFDSASYERVLRNAGMSEAQFEEALRQDLMTQQLVGGISRSEIVTGRDVDAVLAVTEQQRKFSYLVLPAANYAGRVQISDEEIKRFYQDNLDQRFRVPERVVAQYIELSRDALKKKVAVDEAELRHMYDERKASFSVGEERHAHHILISVDQKADPATVEKARARAQELAKRIQHGESFEDLARQYSDDKGSAKSGGDLGFFSRGMMAGPFEDAVFGMKKGELSDPVRSPFGFHVIRLDEIRPGTTRSFDEVRAILEDEYRKSKVEEAFYNLSDRLADLTFEQSDSLTPAADQLGLVVQEIGPFSRDKGEGLANEAAFRQAAFSQDVLEGGHNSTPVELGPDRLVVLRIKDRQPASHLPLDAVKDSIIEELRKRGAAEMAKKDGESIVEEIGHGKVPQDEARAYRASWNPPVPVRRDHDKIPPSILATAFSMDRPKGGAPTVKGMPLASGDYAVIALYEVIEGNPAAVSAEARRRETDMLTQQNEQRMIEETLQSLKARTKVKLYEDKL